METLLEEIALIAASGTSVQSCGTGGGGVMLSPVILEQAVATSPELWGLLQPYAHLNAGRIASGIYKCNRCTHYLSSLKLVSNYCALSTR